MNNHSDKPNWQQRLDEHSSPLDADTFWKGLEPRLPSQPRKRRGFIWWWFLALVLGVGSMWWAYSRIIPKEAPSAALPAEPGHRKMNQDTAVASVDLVGDERKVQGATTTPQAPSTSLRPVQSTMTGQNRPDKGIPAVFGVEGAAMDNPMGPSPQQAVASSAPTQPDPVATPMPPTLLSETQPGTVTIPEEETPGLATDIPLPAAPVTESSGSKEEHPLPTKQERPSRSRWSLHTGFSVGLGLATVAYSGVQADAQARVAERKASERNLEAWSVGAELRLYAPGGWFFQGGMSAQRVIQRYNRTFEETTLTWGLAEGFIRGLEGQLTPWSDITWQQERRTREVRHYNRLETLEIPLALGYEYQWGAWSGDLAMGAVINLGQFASGRSSAGERGPAAWGDVPELTYRRRLGLGGLAQLRLARRIGHRSTVFLQPQWRWQPDSRMAPEAGYSLRLQHLHLQAGVAIALR